MEMWKLDSVFLKIWQFSPYPFNCKKFGRVQLSSNFLLLLSLTAIVFTLTCEISTRFLKKINQKWKYYTEKKRDFVEFMAMWREEQTLWDVIFPLYPDKNEKDKSLRRMSDFWDF